MSDLFSAFAIAGSGMRTHRIWMDAVADNIANINTINPYDQDAFQARYVIAKARRADDAEQVGVGGGVDVSRIAYGSAQGRLRYEPGHPYANADGLVRYPDIDLGEQMTELIVAQRGYQLNLAVIDRARDAYQQALRINGR